jgi:membrane protease YdiL (CAAX protease family)
MAKWVIPGFPSAHGFGRIHSMRNDAQGDVIKVWIYAAASVALGAWMTPLLYNAGKALAEVSSAKTTNGFLEWLAKRCAVAELPEFYQAAILFAALVLFLPWMESLRARGGARTTAGSGPWLLRVPGREGGGRRGQPLRRNLGGLWDAFAGFMVVAGLLLSMGVALVPAGYFTMQSPAEGLGALAMRAVSAALVAAFLMEVFFRGVVMGIFMRAMRPAAALGMTALFFAMVLSVFPPAGLNVPDPDARGTGFGLLSMTLMRFADWRVFASTFVPLLALGAVLCYARWRTASLWLPVGLHTGWIAAMSMLGSLSIPRGVGESAHYGGFLQDGLIPLIAILIAGLLAHRITPGTGHERAAPY